MKILDIYNRLNNLTEADIRFIDSDSPFQLLIGVILSAQTTDRQVNSILPELFRNYPTPESLGSAELKAVEEIVRPTGFFHIKAANIIKTAEIIHQRHKDIVPEDMDTLLTLPGVGRKTANVVRGACFNLPAIIVDTHFQRTVKRLGITEAANPKQIETELADLTPPAIQYRFSMLINKHGRTVCRARTPLCSDCVLQDLCDYYNGKL